MQTMNLRSGSDATVMKLCNHDMDMDMHYTVLVYNDMAKTWPTND